MKLPLLAIFSMIATSLAGPFLEEEEKLEVTFG